ncbi:MAG TPA: hypothetical protein VM841_10080 [Actinomycetota bacterium]|nr:hypothetical protein [Actinomycetota bacterium]
MVRRALLAGALALALTVSGHAAGAHVVDPCASTTCVFWQDHQGNCHKAQKVEISDGTNGGGYTRTHAITQKAYSGPPGPNVQCHVSWYLLAGKHKWQHVVWKQVYVPRYGEYVDAVCYDSGWRTNTVNDWKVIETHDWGKTNGGAPCGPGKYFLSFKASIWIDWINQGKGAWTADQFVIYAPDPYPAANGTVQHNYHSWN